LQIPCRSLIAAFIATNPGLGVGNHISGLLPSRPALGQYHLVVLQIISIGIKEVSGGIIELCTIGETPIRTQIEILESETCAETTYNIRIRSSHDLNCGVIIGIGCGHL